MGQTFSIDKHVSSLDDLLDLSAYYFSKVKFESRISADITQHLKVSCSRSLQNRFGGSQKTNRSSTRLSRRQWLWPSQNRQTSRSTKVTPTLFY